MELPENKLDIFYYGTGLRLAKSRGLLKKLFNELNQNTRLHLFDDLQAAVRATHRQEGMVAILGTGSNACSFTNGEIAMRAGGLGYIIGDEGGGMDLGKYFLKALLEHRFPPALHQAFEKYTATTALEFNVQCLQAKQPQKKLGELAPLIAEYINEDEVYQMVKSRFLAFISSTIEALPHQGLPIDFIGSISLHFQKPLKDALEARNLKMGEIIQHPIKELINYHLINY